MDKFGRLDFVICGMSRPPHSPVALPFHLKFGFGSPLLDLVRRTYNDYAHYHNDTFDFVLGAAGNL